jgi:hypothetical protein
MRPTGAAVAVAAVLQVLAVVGCTGSGDAAKPPPASLAPTTTRPPLSEAIASLGLETSAQPEQDLAQLLEDRSFAPDRASALCMSQRMLDGGAETLVEAGRVLDGEFLFLPDGSVRSAAGLDVVQTIYACTQGQIQLVLTLRGVQPRSAACGVALITEDEGATEAMALYVAAASGPFQAEARRTAARLAGGPEDGTAPGRLLADRLGDCLSPADRTFLTDPP